jgi:ubiquitin-protein ligase
VRAFAVLLYPHTSERTNASANLPHPTVLITIQDKVNNPSPDDPFEPDIAAQLKNDKAKFLTTAKEWTKKCVIHCVASSEIC